MHIVNLALIRPALETSGDWQAVGHALDSSWTSFGSRFGIWIFGALIAFVVLRGLMRAKRYRAAGTLGESSSSALRGRVKKAESLTSGEIVVVVVEASDEHPDAVWKAAAAVLLIGTLLLGGLASSAGTLGFAAIQVGLAGLGFILGSSFADFRRCFIREGRATEVCEEQAIQELQRLDLTSKEERSAVLLFVSVFEQRAIILADTQAHEAVGEEAWVKADAAVVQALRNGDSPSDALRAALEAGIDAIGSVLAGALPSTGARANKFDDSVEIRPR